MPKVYREFPSEQLGEPEPTPYYMNDRVDFVRFLEREAVSLAGRVLEVGCAAGITAPHFRRLGATVLEGIEPHAPAATAANASGYYDTVHSCSWDAWIPSSSRYDAIIFADVLEHLSDPIQVLRRVHSLLRQPSGILVLSLPNVRHLSVLFGLILRGDWEYEPAGILDHTHLRFFTTKSARRLLKDCGFRIVAFDRWGAMPASRAVARLWPPLGEFVLSQFFMIAMATESALEAP